MYLYFSFVWFLILIVKGYRAFVYTTIEIKFLSSYLILFRNRRKNTNSCLKYYLKRGKRSNELQQYLFSSSLVKSWIRRSGSKTFIVKVISTSISIPLDITLWNSVTSFKNPLLHMNMNLTRATAQTFFILLVFESFSALIDITVLFCHVP